MQLTVPLKVKYSLGVTLIKTGFYMVTLSRVVTVARCDRHKGFTVGTCPLLGGRVSAAAEH